MHIVFRADSSELLGTGHLVRCLTLAEALRAQGAQVRLLTRDLPGNVSEQVSKAGFTLDLLVRPAGEAGTAGWFGGVDWEADAAECVATLAASGEAVDWLIVDHYGIDHRWEEQLRPLVARIGVIDDLANRRHDCDLLLDANSMAKPSERYRGLVPPHCRLLLQPRFALLRPEFAAARAGLRPRDGQVRRILVFFGGTDSGNQTTKAIEAIHALHRPEIGVDVVVGATNPHAAGVLEFCRLHPQMVFHSQTNKMAELMSGADLSIGAGGTATWERCAVGLPAVVISVAENQEPSMLLMAEEGRVLYLGDQSQVSLELLSQVLAGLLAIPHWLRLLGTRSAELVDGGGANRVVRHLLAPAIELRRAQAEDSRALWEWRNAPETRRRSFDTGEIPWDDHERWYKNALENRNRILLIGEAGGDPIGVLRYDLDQDRAIVSVYLASGRHGKGLGARLLEAGTAWLGQNYPHIAEIRAEILLDNAASLAVFSDAGYLPYGSIVRKSI